jgi:uncharacterized repeat protein (TIGR02543 family)
MAGSTNPDTITMDGNKTVTATFTQDQYTLTINTVGSGSVTKSPDQATYTYGTIVDVNAIADAGWTFDSWSGDLGGSTNPETITMDGNKTVTATFTEVLPSDNFDDNKRGAMWRLFEDDHKNTWVAENTNRLNVRAIGELLSACVGHWKMNDDATNTTVVDSSGNGNDGTAQQNTSVLHTDGKINGALTFDGTTDYVDCGDIDIGTGPRTFAAWVKADSTSGVSTIIGKDTGGATTEAGWLYQSSSTILWKLRNPAGSSIRMFTTTLTTGGWHFLVATYDTTDMHVYFDGVLDDGPLLGAVPDSVPDNSIPLQIGARGNGTYKFNGTIDNIMIFDRALTIEEIELLYNEGNGTETATAIKGDLNNDGIVNFLDFAELGLAW